MNKLRLFFLIACAFFIEEAAALAQTTVTITAPDATAAEKLVGEAANPGTIRIARSGGTAGALVVYLKSVSGTATRGVDYNFGTAVSSFVSIPSGSSSVDLVVNVIDDWLTEGNETVRIDLDPETPAGTPAPYSISGSSRATVTINDNEDPLLPPRAIVTVEALDAVGTETPGGTDPVVFRLTRSNNLAPALDVLYTLGGSAIPGVSYPAPAGRITIPAGATTVDLVITPIDDLVVEPAESLTFTLQPSGIVTVPAPGEAYAIGAPSTASATIVSDDLPPAPVVTITAPVSNAAAAVGTPVTVNFTASAVDGYIVSYSVSAGGARRPSGRRICPQPLLRARPIRGLRV